MCFLHLRCLLMAVFLKKQISLPYFLRTIIFVEQFSFLPNNGTLPTKLSSATDGHLYFLIFNEDNIFMIIKALNIINLMVKMRFQYG